MKLNEILNEREDVRAKLTKIEVDGIDSRDYPRFTDAHVSSAVWKETGKELTDAELEKLNDDYPEIANEEAHDRAVAGAEAAYDASRGH